jgi:hypothetical protein
MGVSWWYEEALPKLLHLLEEDHPEREKAKRRDREVEGQGVGEPDHQVGFSFVRLPQSGKIESLGR